MPFNLAIVLRMTSMLKALKTVTTMMTDMTLPAEILANVMTFTESNQTTEETTVIVTSIA